MTIQTIKEVIAKVVEGKYSINEGAETLNMSLIDFERLMNAWEDKQLAWGKMLEIAIISELKNGKTTEEIVTDLKCREQEVEWAERRWKKTQQIFEDVREKQKTLTCGSCIARVYISEFARMMEQQEAKTHE